MNCVAMSLVITYHQWKYAAVQNELHTQLWTAGEKVGFHNRLCHRFVRNKICCELVKSSSHVSEPNTGQNNVLNIFIQIQIFA